MLDKEANSHTIRHAPELDLTEDYIASCYTLYLMQKDRVLDKMKDDAIAHLSDQLMALTARMQDLERRQQ